MSANWRGADPIGRQDPMGGGGGEGRDRGNSPRELIRVVRSVVCHLCWYSARENWKQGGSSQRRGSASYTQAGKPKLSRQPQIECGGLCRELGGERGRRWSAAMEGCALFSRNIERAFVAGGWALQASLGGEAVCSAGTTLGVQSMPVCMCD